MLINFFNIGNNEELSLFCRILSISEVFLICLKNDDIISIVGKVLYDNNA